MLFIKSYTNPDGSNNNATNCLSAKILLGLMRNMFKYYGDVDWQMMLLA